VRKGVAYRVSGAFDVRPYGPLPSVSGHIAQGPSRIGRPSHRIGYQNVQPIEPLADYLQGSRDGGLVFEVERARESQPQLASCNLASCRWGCGLETVKSDAGY